MVTPEEKKVERYLWGLSSQIHDSVLASKPTTFESAKELAKQLIDHRASRGTVIVIPGQTKGDNNKRKFWSNKKKQSTPGSSKKQQTIAIYAATTPSTSAPRKQYVGTLPKCDKCGIHHNAACQELHCNNCNKKGHTA